MNGTHKNMKQIVAAVERKMADGEVKTWWTRVGVAFENVDASHCTSGARGVLVSS